MQGAKEENKHNELAAGVSASLEVPNSVSANTTEPSQTREAPVILEQYRELYEQNTDMEGWIKIDGTGIDYPVMYTVDDFYLSHVFDKGASKSGVRWNRSARIPSYTAII